MMPCRPSMAAGVAVTVRRACGREVDDQLRKFVRQAIRVVELLFGVLVTRC